MTTQITSKTKITAIKPRKSGGKKTKFHALIPKRGAITCGALRNRAAKELHVPAKKVEPWLRGFVRRGLVKLH